MVEVYEIDHLVEFVDTIPLSKRWIFRDFIGFFMVYIPSYTTHMAVSGGLAVKEERKLPRRSEQWPNAKEVAWTWW